MHSYGGRPNIQRGVFAEDSDGNDWLYCRHFGQYLLAIKHDYAGAVTALEKAYTKAIPKNYPLTIGLGM